MDGHVWRLFVWHISVYCLRKAKGFESPHCHKILLCSSMFMIGLAHPLVKADVPFNLFYYERN